MPAAGIPQPAREPLTRHAAVVDAWRPRFHVTGERNWINDPNGPIQRDGVHHLFYQANPDAPFWGAPHWGHVTSTDLVHWTRRPAALVPEPGGPDADGCWSGCTRMVGARPAIYYTGVAGGVEAVCRAWGSGDLLRWEKDAANPLVAAAPGAYHRDPFLWEDAQGWHMLVGSGSDGEDAHGTALRYASADATSWRAAGVFFAAPRHAGDLDLGRHWECPQLVLRGRDAVLVVSCSAPEAERPLLHAVAFTGTVAGGRFAGEPAGRLDHGDVFYAPAVARDEAGRDLVWGWAQERLGTDAQALLTHAGALTVPRELIVEGHRVRTPPVPELTGLRQTPLEPRNGGYAAAPQMELAATFEGRGGRAEWILTANAGARVAVGIDAGEEVLSVTVADGTAPPRGLRAPLPPGERHALRVLVDGSLLEAFADDGAAAITTCAYPRAGSWAAVRLEHADGPRVTAARAWRRRDDVIAER